MSAAALVEGKTYSWGDFRFEIAPNEIGSYSWRVRLGAALLDMAQGESATALAAFSDSRWWVARHLGDLKSRLKEVQGNSDSGRHISDYYKLAEELSLLIQVGKDDYPLTINPNPLGSFQLFFDSEVSEPTEALGIVTNYINKRILNDLGEQTITVTDDYKITLASGLPVEWTIYAKSHWSIGDGTAENRSLAISTALTKLQSWIDAHFDNGIGKHYENLEYLGRLKQLLAMIKCAIDTHNIDWQKRLLTDPGYYDYLGVTEIILKDIDLTSPTAFTEYRDKLEQFINTRLEHITTLAFLDGDFNAD